MVSGGAGNDIFVCSGSLSGSITINGLLGVDLINDFTSTQDKISLSKSTFGAITGAVGAAMGGDIAPTE